VLCGSVLSCSDGLEQRAHLRAQRPRLQRLEEESDEDEGDGSAKPETMEQAYQGFDVKTFGGEATGAPSPLPLTTWRGLGLTSVRCRVNTAPSRTPAC